MLGLQPTQFISEQHCYHALTGSATSATCKNNPLLHPSLAAELASHMPGKINEVEFMF